MSIGCRASRVAGHEVLNNSVQVVEKEKRVGVRMKVKVRENVVDGGHGQINMHADPSLMTNELLVVVRANLRASTTVNDDLFFFPRQRTREGREISSYFKNNKLLRIIRNPLNLGFDLFSQVITYTRMLYETSVYDPLFLLITCSMISFPSSNSRPRKRLFGRLDIRILCLLAIEGFIGYLHLYFCHDC